MKIKKVLLAVIIAICTVIGCTSCGAKKIEEDGNSPSTVVVTRPDYGGDVKIHIIKRDEYKLENEELENLTNEWLAENKNKTILSIEFHFVNKDDMRRYGLVFIVYRDNDTTSANESV